MYRLLLVVATLGAMGCAPAALDDPEETTRLPPGSLGEEDAIGDPFVGTAKDDSVLPDRVDHSSVMLPIRPHQGSRGTCYSFATAAEIEAHDDTGTYVSVEEIAKRTWRGNPVTGWISRELISYQDWAPESSWPYGTPEPADVAAHDTWPTGQVISTGLRESKLKNYLAASRRNNIVVGMYWASDFIDRGTGVIDSLDKDGDTLPWSPLTYYLSHDSCSSHAVLFVGYETRVDADGESRTYYKFRNSFGPSWGDHGYGYVSSRYLARMGLLGHMLEPDSD